MQRTEDELRDGYAKGRAASLAEVAAVLGVTIEGARQIERKALRKLKKWLRERGIEESDEVSR